MIFEQYLIYVSLNDKITLIMLSPFFFTLILIIRIKLFPDSYRNKKTQLQISFNEISGVKQRIIWKFSEHLTRTIFYNCPLFHGEIILFAPFEQIGKVSRF